MQVKWRVQQSSQCSAGRPAERAPGQRLLLGRRTDGAGATLRAPLWPESASSARERERVVPLRAACRQSKLGQVSGRVCLSSSYLRPKCRLFRWLKADGRGGEKRGNLNALIGLESGAEPIGLVSASLASPEHEAGRPSSLEARSQLQADQSREACQESTLSRAKSSTQQWRRRRRCFCWRS